MSVPGVGAVTGSSFATAIEDPDGFSRSRSVGAWLGLTTRRFQSGEVDDDRTHLTTRRHPSARAPLRGCNCHPDADLGRKRPSNMGPAAAREDRLQARCGRSRPQARRDLLDKVAKSGVGFVHTIARDMLRRRLMARPMVNPSSRSGRARPAKDGVHDGQVVPGTPPPQP